MRRVDARVSSSGGGSNSSGSCRLVKAEQKGSKGDVSHLSFVFVAKILVGRKSCRGWEERRKKEDKREEGREEKLVQLVYTVSELSCSLGGHVLTPICDIV